MGTTPMRHEKHMKMSFEPNYEIQKYNCVTHSIWQVINLVIILLYRFGYVGDFLGVGGTWNLNEEKSADAEIIASGVFVGFFIYTGVQLMAYLFGTTAHKR